MKNALTRLFGSTWSGLITGLVLGLAAVMPMATTAQTSVGLQGSLRAANVTAGDTEYKEAISASPDQIIKMQLYYRNTAEAGSDDVANNVRVKIALPTQTSAKQTITATVKGSNTHELKDQVAVSVDREEARLQYIPGTAVWKHNTGTAEQPKIEETKISDEVIVGAQGVELEDQKPGEQFGSSVTVQLRVMAPGVNTTIESQVKGETNKWSANNSAKPGNTMRYIVAYQNTSNIQQRQVVVRGVLPAKMQLVPGSTMLYNTTNPDGVKVASDNIAAGGVVIGNYGPGANAYVTFEAAITAADQLSCGNNEFRVVSFVRPEGMSEYFNSTMTTAKRECAAQKPAPSPAPTQPQATYSCDSLTVTKGEGRKISAKVAYTATNGATLKLVSYDFGDGTQPFTTDKTTVEHTYAKDGTYNVTATLTIATNGKDQTATSAACAKAVSFVAAPANPTPTPPAAAAGSGLPDSGPGSMAALFVGASSVGFIVHRLFFGRRLPRR